MLPHNAHALGGEGVAHIVVLVVEVVVGLESQRATAVEQILDVKVANEVAALVVGVVAVAEVAVKQQSVVEQLAGEGKVDLHVAEVAPLAAEIGRDAPLLAHLAQDVGQLR